MSNYAPAVAFAKRCLDTQLVSRLWQRDQSVWGAAPGSAEARSIETRLGWLDIGSTMTEPLPQVVELGEQVKAEGVQAVYLLGMGGSSLCAEVMRAVCGVADEHPELYVLDTTDETTILNAAGRLDAGRALFVVASKSGGTVEVSSLERFFGERVAAALGADAAQRFVAITDPGTALHRLAEASGYRRVFLNPPDIGGRFSALSLFGLVPAALVGADPANLLRAAATLAEGCRQEHLSNPGLELGAFIGATTLEGRDKLTLVLPSSIASLGLWIEQLIAESTGKHGKGTLPVVDEPLREPSGYGQDRAFVAIATDRDAPDAKWLDAIEQAGHPVLRLSTRIDGLGAEFFRWEFATAIAGAALGINPFDEPNVSEAKEKTKAILSGYAGERRLPAAPAVAVSTEAEAFSTTLTGDSPAAVVAAALATLTAATPATAGTAGTTGDYVAFLSYLPSSQEIDGAFAAIRAAIGGRFHAATTYGVGPRYLHSTGQYHKGGPNTAVAFVVTADDGSETEIPGAGYSFAVLKRAQALGDTETLEAHGRRTVRLHLRGGVAGAGAALERIFADALA